MSPSISGDAYRELGVIEVVAGSYADARAHFERVGGEHGCHAVRPLTPRTNVFGGQTFTASETIYHGACLTLRRSWSDGTTHIRFTPFELIERLAALVPRPGSNLVLYHGVFAANSSWRERIVERSPEQKSKCACDAEHPAARPNHTWAELLRRGLDIDSLECPKKCGGRLRFIACIDQPAVIALILRHVDLPAEPVHLEPARAPPDEWQLGPAA